MNTIENGSVSLVNLVVVIIGIVVAAYFVDRNNKIFISVRDKNNRVHKIPVKTTDSEKTVLKKVNDYMKKQG